MDGTPEGGHENAPGEHGTRNGAQCALSAFTLYSLWTLLFQCPLHGFAFQPLTFDHHLDPFARLRLGRA